MPEEKEAVVEEQEEVSAEEAVEEKETTEVAAEETEETAEEAAEGSEEAVEGSEEAEPSAEELKKQLKERNDEIAKLKGEKKDDDEIPDVQMEAVEAEGKTIGGFMKEIYPAAKTLFTKSVKEGISISDDGSLKIDQALIEKQFDVMMEATDKYINAKLNDHIYPHIRNLGRMNVVLQNDRDILLLRSENPKFSKYELQVRKALAKMDIVERGKKNIVKDTFAKLKGSDPVADKEEEENEKNPKKKPLASRKMLRDVAAGAGGGKSKKPVVVNLTDEQEEDRQAIEALEGPFPKELYAAKLKAMQDKAKAAGKKIPQTLR